MNIQYVKDDVVADIKDKCDLCQFKYVASTKCCNIKLCDWHLRNDGEHADQAYYSCSECETSQMLNKGYLVIYNTIYCEKHNPMLYCNICANHFCNEHEHHCI